ncbi:MAG: STAS domain-containing protein [Sedimentisphaerales bacterium]|nr:STAS domain-containing protein [Sedimentisphaerales bacterium]
MEKHGPRIEVTREGSITIVDLLDEEVLEEHIIADIAESLFGVIEDEKPVKMVLSFARVKHMSSAALGMLIRLNKHTEETGGCLKLCDIREALYQVFLITKLNKLFDIYDNEDTAVKSF